MSHENRHIILRQVVELELTNKPRGDRHAIAEETSRLSREVLPKIIDRSFSKAAGQSEFLAVDLLEVELEVDSLDKLEEALREQLPALLDEALRDALDGQTSLMAHQGTTAAAYSDWIITFLEQGYLPWSAPEDISLSQLTYYLSELLANDSSFVKELRSLLLKKRFVLRRFLYHFGHRAAWWTLVAIDPVIENRWTIEDQNQLLFATTKIEEEQLRGWQILLRHPEIIPEAFIKRLAEYPSPKIQEHPEDDELELEGRVKKDPIYLKNAGMVLLHPFLNILFEAVGLAKDQKVIDVDRAASLLHYLATGENEGLEWDMVMPKILLGIRLDKPLKFSKLSDPIKQEAHQLLETVIRHWTVLGKTSIDGFRESFLQRPGRLSFLSDKLYLKVEQRPYDLLLDQLPWGINYILLPWMPIPLHTEWV